MYLPSGDTINSTDISSQLMESYGFMQYTCERYPKVTHINAQMLEYLDITEENSSWQEFLKENIFFMIPFEERDAFREHLEQVLRSSEALHFKQNLLRSDGSCFSLLCCMCVIMNEKNEHEYALVCVPTDVLTADTHPLQDKSYFHALRSAYNVIFEINLTTRTIECIHGRETSDIGPLYDVHMTLESASNFWLNNYIVEEDREMVQKYFRQLASPPSSGGSFRVLQTEFRMKWTDHVVYHFLCVAVHLDPSTILLCCRDISNLKYTGVPAREAIALDKLNDWIDFETATGKAAAGMLLLEESGDGFSLIYASKTVCDYLGLSRNEYLRYISGEFPVERFLACASVATESFNNLLRSGHIDLTVSNSSPDSSRQLHVTCSSHLHGHKRLYEVLIHDNSQLSKMIPTKGIFARTFGHFDLFVDGIPVNFAGAKEKELMALLIDRNGGTLSTSEAISYLWENETANERVSARYRKLAMGLKNTLQKYGIEHILINNHGMRSIHVSAITCDYYELLAGNEAYQNAFHNCYMTDYSWAENTLATLWDYS